MSSTRPLSTTRNLVLRSAGYFVQPVASGAEALEKLAASEFDLALVGHSIGDDEQRQLTIEIKRRWQKLPVIVMPHSGGAQVPEADYQIEALTDPRVLLQEIEKLLLPQA